MCEWNVALPHIWRVFQEFCGNFYPRKIFLGRVYFLRIFSTSPFSVKTWKQVDKNNMKVQDKENLGQALKINGKVG